MNPEPCPAVEVIESTHSTVCQRAKVQNLPIHQDLRRVLEGLLVQLGQRVPEQALQNNTILFVTF